MFQLNRRVNVQQRTLIPVIIPALRHGEGSIMVMGDLQSRGLAPGEENNWIRPAITAYGSITLSHLERITLLLKDLYSCKIMWKHTCKLCQRHIKIKSGAASPSTYDLAGAIRELISRWTSMDQLDRKIKATLGMKNISAQLWPRLLTPDQKYTKLIMRREDLFSFVADPAIFLMRPNSWCVFNKKILRQLLQWKPFLQMLPSKSKKRDDANLLVCKRHCFHRLS